MSEIKEEAKELIERLPESASWEDLMYEIYVRTKIEAGLKAADEGNVVDHADVKKRYGIA